MRIDVTYLNCPRCALSVPERTPEPHSETPCPRCLGQAGLIVPMYRTDQLRPPVAPREHEPQLA
jgi:hypothetical protein